MSPLKHPVGPVPRPPRPLPSPTLSPIDAAVNTGKTELKATAAPMLDGPRRRPPAKPATMPASPDKPSPSLLRRAQSEPHKNESRPGLLIEETPPLPFINSTPTTQSPASPSPFVEQTIPKDDPAEVKPPASTNDPESLLKPPETPLGGCLVF